MLMRLTCSTETGNYSFEYQPVFNLNCSTCLCYHLVFVQSIVSLVMVILMMILNVVCWGCVSGSVSDCDRFDVEIEIEIHFIHYQHTCKI